MYESITMSLEDIETTTQNNSNSNSDTDDPNQDSGCHLSVEETSKSCVICYDETRETVYDLVHLCNMKRIRKKCQCNVFLHNECMDVWLGISYSCPVCRENFEEPAKKISIIHCTCVVCQNFRYTIGFLATVIFITYIYFKLHFQTAFHGTLTPTRAPTAHP